MIIGGNIDVDGAGGSPAHAFLQTTRRNMIEDEITGSACECVGASIDFGDGAMWIRKAANSSAWSVRCGAPGFQGWIGEAAAHVLRSLSRTVGAGSDAQQKITKLGRSADAGHAINTTTLGSNFPAALGTFDADAGDDLGIKAHFRLAPAQFRQVDADRVKPSGLAGVVTILPLLDTAGPTALEISSNPATSTRRPVQVKVRPSMGLFRMLQDTAECADGFKRGSEATAVIALDLPLASALDPQRLTGPQLAPPLAGWMRDDRVRASILPSIPRLVPSVDAGQAEIAAISFDVESRDHLHPHRISRQTPGREPRRIATAAPRSGSTAAAREAVENPHRLKPLQMKAAVQAVPRDGERALGYHDAERAADVLHRQSVGLGDLLIARMTALRYLTADIAKDALFAVGEVHLPSPHLEDCGDEDQPEEGLKAAADARGHAATCGARAFRTKCENCEASSFPPVAASSFMASSAGHSFSLRSWDMRPLEMPSALESAVKFIASLRFK